MAPQREWFEKDYYSVLGVSKDATEKDISRAYKKLAKQHHPDANPGNAAAEERFKEVSAAYDVLGDKDKKSEYDEVRRMVAAGVGPGGPGAGGFGGPGGFTFDFGDVGGEGAGGVFSDLLGGLFGRGGAGGGRSARGRRAHGPQRGQDLETELHLSFGDAVHGVTSTVRFRADAECETCHGSGARPGTHPDLCPQCGGSGAIAVDQGPFSFSQVCPNCGGRGQIIKEPCPTCHGRGVEMRPREVKVRVPAGVEDGQRIRVKGRGGAGANGGPSGDLYVVVHVKEHPLFGRSGDNLTVRLPLTFAEAALGAEVKVPTLGEPVTVRIPPGTPPGKTLRVRGRGIPTANGKGPGDLLVTVDVQVPAELSDEQRAAVEALASAFPDDPRAGLTAAAQTRRAGDTGGA
jgi:molecular chaperone DnaJ